MKGDTTVLDFLNIIAAKTVAEKKSSELHTWCPARCHFQKIGDNLNKVVSITCPPSSINSIWKAVISSSASYVLND